MSTTVDSTRIHSIAACREPKMKKNSIQYARIIGMILILAHGVPVAMSMEDGLAPPGAQQGPAKTKAKKTTESQRGGNKGDDQALGGHKQESLRPPATPNGLVNPCQMADSPKWCDGQ
jgi:hypothetical protein